MQTTKKNRKLSRSIIYIVLIVFVLSIFTINAVQYLYYSKKMSEQAIAETKSLMNLIEEKYKDIESQLVQLSSTIIVNEDLCKLMNTSSTQPLEILRTKLKVEAQLKSLVTNYDFINGAIIIRDDGLIYSSARIFETYYRSTLSQAWYSELKDNNNFHYSMIHETYTENSGYCDVISYRINFFELRNPNTHHFKLILNIPISYFQNYLSTINLKSGYAILRNHWDDTIYSDFLGNSNYDDILNQKDGKEIFETSKYMVLNRDIMHDEWTLSIFISKYNLFQNDIGYILLILLISTVVFLLVSIIITIYINRKLRPLTLLRDSMLSLPYSRVIPEIVYDPSNEIGCIWSAFLEMKQELNSSIEKMIEAELNRKNISSDLLLSRINLHFIYNTLNTFIFLVSAKRNEDAITMTRAFISLLHDVIQVGQEKITVSLQEEIATIQQYMIIQNYKYPQPIKVIYDIDENLMDCLIPKMSLEPIVENSVFHGFTQMDYPGEIIIKAEHIKQYLWITISDNGIGMSEKTVEDILLGKENTEMKAHTRGIGIKNIQDRLRLIYGDQSEFILSSIEDVGTTVKFFVPYSKNKKKE